MLGIATQLDLKEVESNLNAKLDKVEGCVHKAEARIVQYLIRLGLGVAGLVIAAAGVVVAFITRS